MFDYCSRPIAIRLSALALMLPLALAACGGDGASPADNSDTTDSQTPTVGTANIECDYSYSQLNESASINLTSTATWSCTDTERALVANAIPDHEVGTFPNAANPNTITEQVVDATMPISPVLTDTATELGGPRGPTGYVLNGVKMDPGTAGTCTDAADCNLGGNGGSWSIEALGQAGFDFGTDTNNAHVQPTGEYHYHGLPEGFITLRGGNASTMTLIGWASDGFPIYARYGYISATDASSGLKSVTGSYQFVSTVNASRPAVASYPLGTFTQDYEYAAGVGDLDECNGRTGVTPEFPEGTYHYYATETYPFMPRCVKGKVEAGGEGLPPPQGDAGTLR